MATVRPDLATAEYTSTGYLHEIIAPTLKVFQKGGTLYYTPYATRGTAQTSRSALGSVTATTMASASKTFSCGEILSRKKMSYDEVEQGYSDLLTAELDMAAAGKDEVEASIETSLATALLDANSAKDLTASTNLPGDIENYAAELMDKAPDCEIALAISSTLFTSMKANGEIKARMQNTGIAVGEGGDPRAVTAAQLAAVLGVNRVLVGKSSIWGKHYAALVMLPHAEKAQNQEAQLARTVAYMTSPADGIPFTCESFEDDNAKGYVVDTHAHAAVTVLNAGLSTCLLLASLPVINPETN